MSRYSTQSDSYNGTLIKVQEISSDAPAPLAKGHPEKAMFTDR
jgi:hypothetical protein